jgi:hypothetical protein
MEASNITIIWKKFPLSNVANDVIFHFHALCKSGIMREIMDELSQKPETETNCATFILNQLREKSLTLEELSYNTSRYIIL